MQHNAYLQSYSYLNNLETIEGIKFTSREIDILACMLSGKAAGVIGALLDISARTIESHTLNIRTKLECSSRNGIIEFLEKSDKLSLLKTHYHNLVIEDSFKKVLKNISNLHKQELTAPIICSKNQKSFSSLIQIIQQCLALAGIKTSLDIREKIELLVPICPRKKTYSSGYMLYALDKETLEHLPIEENTNEDNLKTNIFSPITSKEDFSKVFILFGEGQIPKAIHNNVYIDFNDPTNFYFDLLELVKKILPSLDINKVTYNFGKQYALLHGTSKQINEIISTNAVNIVTKKSLFQILKAESLPNKHPKRIAIRVIGLCIFLIGVLIFTYFRAPSSTDELRMDLIIPVETSLLQRPQIIKKINECLASSKGIQVAALVGIGGIGKTTLARYYGRSQNASIIWEINAESKESLISSFKDLANALALTPYQKEELSLMKKIQDPEEKEKKLLSIIKTYLKTHPHWLLIYDNVEAFSDIKNYFPQDSHAWGNGKIIITSQDANIKNTSYIQPEQVIEIEELDKEEALALFSKILYNAQPEQLSSEQKKKTLILLEKLPPFPLDVAVAAYYVKNTNINEEQYLEKVSENCHNFTKYQTTLLQEVGNYSKTRCEIIALSFKALIDINPEFKNLLLLICLLDSQNIPQHLLEFYKDKFLIESFIYNLKKYSLITSTGFLDKRKEKITFSLHRSTQVMGLIYLLNILNKDQQKTFIDELTSSIKTFYEAYSPREHRSCTNIATLIPHLEALLRKISSLKLPRTLENQYEQEIALILGGIYNKCARNLPMAKKYLSQAYHIQNKDHTLPPPALANLLKDLGRINIDLSLFEEAIAFCKDSIKIGEHLPQSTLLVARNLKTLGNAYAYKNDFKNAEFYFKAALDKTIKLEPQLKRDLLSEIYGQLAVLYSETYLNQSRASEAEKYAYEALKVVNASHSIHKTQQPKEFPNCRIARLKIKLGEVYCRLGKYEEAIERGFLDAQYINNHVHDDNPHIFAKGSLAQGIGEIFLRKGQLQTAEHELTKSILIFSKLEEDSSYTLIPKILRAETRIKLNKLDQAYTDCTDVFKIKRKPQTNYMKLISLICFYHAAVIKYKQNDLKNSIEHLVDFFKGIKEFCKEFLDEKAYKDLEDRGAFTIHSYDSKHSKEHINTYLKNSVDIFTTIYGVSHPFVRDYIIPNYNQAIKPWYKFF